MGTPAPPEIQAIKDRIRTAWTTGDFGVIAPLVREAEEALIARLDIRPGMKVLDVGCGTGNSAIPAARRGADVVGIDIAPNLLEQARERAKAEGLNARFEEGDAEDLAFADGSFDFVISIFGAMFAPRPELVAAEFKRVCRSGGTIVMGNWTPRSFSGQTYRLVAKYLPPPPGLIPPIQWGDEATVRERFRAGISRLQMTPRIVTFIHPFSEEEVVQHYRRHFGPTIRTFEALDPAARDAFHRDSVAQWKQNNKASDGTVRVDSEFLEIIATRA